MRYPQQPIYLKDRYISDIYAYAIRIAQRYFPSRVWNTMRARDHVRDIIQEAVLATWIILKECVAPAEWPYPPALDMTVREFARYIGRQVYRLAKELGYYKTRTGWRFYASGARSAWREALEADLRRQHPYVYPKVYLPKEDDDDELPTS